MEYLKEMRQANLSVKAEIDAPAESVRRWFLGLESHPEWYQFGTHEGFQFTSGAFGDVGSRFETRERFLGIPVSLRFEVKAVDEEGFVFSLLRPRLPIQGAFVIARSGAAGTTLTLQVGATGGLGAWFLRLPCVRVAVRGQLRREVEHIRGSIEGPTPSP